MDPSARPYCSDPALRGDQLAFVAAGELWLLTLGERHPRRLTDVTGLISRPHVSPDGKLIAFASTDDGPSALHVMPAQGGAALRLVFHSAPCFPVGFSADSTRVLFVSPLASTNPRCTNVFSVPATGGEVRAEGLGPASAVAYSADGRKMVVARGYQDPATWKRYSGGRAGRLWAGAADGLALRCISSGSRGECQPAFWGERVVFLSDSDGVGNLWSSELDGSDRKQHTHHEEFYARRPSVDGSRVAYQHAGDIRLLDLATGESECVELDIGADTAGSRRRYVAPLRFLESAEPDKAGDRILLTSRGKVFCFPTWRGPVHTLAEKGGVRFSQACWLPDGESVVLAHDASGEEELEVRALDGEPPRSLGRVGEGRLRRLIPSPDGRLLAVSEQATGLFVIDIESGERSPVDVGDSGAILEFCWSPDSRWLAYARPTHYRASLFLHDTQEGSSHRVTNEEFDDGSPCFCPQGRYLYFLSRRVYNPYRDELEHDVGFPATTQPYAVILADDRLSPFSPLPAEELGLGKQSNGSNKNARAAKDKSGSESDDPAKEEEKGGKGKASEPTRIDLEGIEHRVVEIPVSEGRYVDILATKDKVFFLRRPLAGMGGRAGRRPSQNVEQGRLVAYDLASREGQTQATGVRGACLSGDGSKLLLLGERALRLVESKAPPKNVSVAAGSAGEKSGVIDLGRVRIRVEPSLEWQQMFREAWRQQRGHFWTESMTEVDWEAMFSRYQPLVQRARLRQDLSDILWELQGELGTSHAYVVGGDVPHRETHAVGLLGADLEMDEASEKYRLRNILRGDSWQPGAHSPLSLPGLSVSDGDFLLAVDGREAGGALHPWSLLERSGPAVTLRIGPSADGENSRDIVVTPLKSEYAARYREWVRANQAAVEEGGGGRIGYVHVPDMQVDGLVEFHRGFLWQSGRDALIVDVRENGGGNVSQILLGKLRRQLIGYCKARWAEPQPVPGHTMSGPMVALCNERTGSDGDIFCQSWKQLGLGPLIGTRTWGGVVGIDSSKRLVDHGYITQPEYAFWFKDEDWDVEGVGVSPDIEVEITPADHAAGRDPQLARALVEAQALLEQHGSGRPELTPPPDRSRKRG